MTAQASERAEKSQMDLSEEKTSPMWLHPVFLTIVALAAVVRLPGCFSDFWLDEIWTLFGANQLNSLVEIFTKIRHDNNHHLNTLIFYLVGDQKYWMVYRIHSLISGIGTVILAWFIARRAGILEAIIASLLTAGSYLLIHFSSEARGYALVIFFAFATFLAARRFAENKRWLSVVVFWLCVCLGFLSHLTYLHVFIAVAVWLLVHLFRTCENKLDAIVRFAQCFGVPTISLGCFYAFAIRGLGIGGGPPYKLIDVLVKAFSYAGGGPAAGPVAVVVSVVTAGLFLLAVMSLWQKEHSEWIFYLIVIFLSPVVSLATKRHEVMFVRYFLVNIAFGFVAISYMLADMSRRGHLARMCVTVVILLFLVGNGVNIAIFFRYGHGRYLEGLRYMADHTPGQVVTIASNDDFGNAILVEYYKRYLPQGKRIAYISRSQHLAQAPMWRILNRIGDPGEIFPMIRSRHGNTYKLVKALPYSGLSGWHWFIYQRHDRAGTGPVDLNSKPR